MCDLQQHKHTSSPFSALTTSTPSLQTKAEHRHELPQLGKEVFITDGGLETTLIFHEGYELPFFAAFDLLNSESGCTSLIRYYESYIRIALAAQQGIIIESPTWRANADWAVKLGYSNPQLAQANRQAIDLLARLRERYQTPDSKIVISGCIGPRGDGYTADQIMTSGEAWRYHAPQVNTFADSAADIVSALTMTHSQEAIGITLAAQEADIPVSISFTTELDGKLPSGESIAEAITIVDEQTDHGPAYYMINCAHPDHFSPALQHESWMERIRGIRANASCKSHAELDECETLDDGDPQKLADLYRQIRERFGHLNIFGGCCGTDHRHIARISVACADKLNAAI